MKTPFEIEWCGGPAEKHFRKLRPFVDSLPWGTLDAKRHAPVTIDRARIAWSSIALAEYRAAVAFGDVMAALLRARAPLDLVGMGGDFVADELMHVELASRIAMELGGGAPLTVDFDAMRIDVDPTRDARGRANEMMLRVGCIAETLSGAFAIETRSVVEHPLIHAIVERVAADEARHMRWGWLYMEWAMRDATDVERRRLAQVAVGELGRIAPTWRTRADETVKCEILAPLARIGIVPEEATIAALFE